MKNKFLDVLIEKNFKPFLIKKNTVSNKIEILLWAENIDEALKIAKDLNSSIEKEDVMEITMERAEKIDKRQEKKLYKMKKKFENDVINHFGWINSFFKENEFSFVDFKPFQLSVQKFFDEDYFKFPFDTIFDKSKKNDKKNIKNNGDENYDIVKEELKDSEKAFEELNALNEQQSKESTIQSSTVELGESSDSDSTIEKKHSHKHEEGKNHLIKNNKDKKSVQKSSNKKTNKK